MPSKDGKRIFQMRRILFYVLFLFVGPAGGSNGVVWSVIKVIVTLSTT